MEDKNTPQEQNNQTSKFKSFAERFKKKTPQEQADDMTAFSHTESTPHTPKDTRKAKPYQNRQGNSQNNNEQGQKSFEKRKWQGKNPMTQNQNKNSSHNEPKDGIREVQNANEKGNLGLHKDLKRGVEANTRIQRQSLNPHSKLNLNTKASVRITPLGGLGEIGGNITVI